MGINQGQLHGGLQGSLPSLGWLSSCIILVLLLFFLILVPGECWYLLHVHALLLFR